MIKNLLISFLFIGVLSLAAHAELPSWVKGGKSAKYPEDQFLAAVGKGSNEKEAVADSHRNILKKVEALLVSNGIEKVKINISPTTLFKAYEKGYAYNDKENNMYYVFGVIDKNMVRINIEDDLYAAEQSLQYRTALYETSKLSVIPKIKAINELLELYDRRDSVVALKKALTGSIINVEVGEFEREKLAMEKKSLFDNIVYYISSDNFDTSKLVKYMQENNYDMISHLPSKPVSGDKGVAVISCRIQVNKAPGRTDNACDWIADLVLSDAFNENTVLYSKTAAGDENGKDAAEASAKALSAAGAEMNAMAEEFFKSIN